MDKIETYCHEEFILQFLDNFIIDPLDNKSKQCNELYELLLRKSEIGIDSTKKLIVRFDNPYAKYLVKMSTTGGSIIHEVPHYFENIKENPHDILKDNPCSLHYLKEHSFKNSSDLGLFLSDLTNYLENTADISIRPVGIKVHPKPELNEFFKWSEMKFKLPPRNSIILADNYLLNNEKRFENNLFDLLKWILPTNLLEQDFHISIITRTGLGNDNTKKYEKIKNFLSTLNRPYSIRLGIFFVTMNKLHDRILISNYFRINVGHSFELLNDKGTPNKDTMIHYFPINSESNVSSHFSTIRSLSNSIKNAEFLGDRENRLLDFYS